MELSAVIQELYQKREVVDDLIASLEEQQRRETAKAKRVPKKRGRKFMDGAAREEASVRMKKYWAVRKAQRTILDLEGCSGRFSSALISSEGMPGQSTAS